MSRTYYFNAIIHYLLFLKILPPFLPQCSLIYERRRGMIWMSHLELRVLQSLMLWTLPSMGLCVNHHLLKTCFSVESLEMIHQSMGIIIDHQVSFNSVSLKQSNNSGFLLRLMNCRNTGYWPHYQCPLQVPTLGAGFKYIMKWLVIPMTLCHLLVCLTFQVLRIAYRVDSWLKSIISFLF